MAKVNTEGYVYVMISTLNQMVNYIPLKYFKEKDKKFDDIINITVQEADYVNNDKWDENLENILKKEGLPFKRKDEKHIKIAQNDVNDIENTLDLLDTLQDKPKIFWNITGGQRPFILAIQQFIQEHKRTQDYVCYLEGNKSKMVILQNNEKIDNESYNLEGLTIETALELMGFVIKVTETSHRNLIEKYDEVKDEREFYLKFLDKYIKDANLRKNCILLNRESEKATAQTAIKNALKDLTYSKLDEELDRNKAFGFILEKLAGYKILEVANGKIADMTFGEKINHLREEDKADEYHIDEFDIALLTKNGKFMIFECKSGGMEGDIAKSAKYSTYAVSGVYGKPILITPLLENEIIAIRDKSHLSDNTFEYLKGNLYKTIRQAINSALRAGLEVWGIDEIATKLKKYTNQTGATK
jgi:hypothetical protein